MVLSTEEVVFITLPSNKVIFGFGWLLMRSRANKYQEPFATTK